MRCVVGGVWRMPGPGPRGLSPISFSGSGANERGCFAPSALLIGSGRRGMRGPGGRHHTREAVRCAASLARSRRSQRLASAHGSRTHRKELNEPGKAGAGWDGPAVPFCSCFLALLFHSIWFTQRCAENGVDVSYLATGRLCGCHTCSCLRQTRECIQLVETLERLD